MLQSMASGRLLQLCSLCLPTLAPKLKELPIFGISQQRQRAQATMYQLFKLLDAAQVPSLCMSSRKHTPIRGRGGHCRK